MNIIVNLFLILSTLLLLYLITFFCDMFTNAIENLGNYLKIQDGVLGSIFAAIGTALPETVLPLIAVFGAYISGSDIDIGQQIGQGAVLGSPFMLSSLAFFFVSLWVCIISLAKKRTCYMNIDSGFFRRDLKFFILAYSIGICSAFIPGYFRWVQVFIGLLLLVFYLIYVTRTIKKHSVCNDDYCENECEELLCSKIFFFKDKYKFNFIILQLLISVVGLVFSAHLFVENIKETAAILGISAMIISLFLAPVATELPETINGIVWSSHKKDILALSNITGAMVFQACIPMAIGIFFTKWEFSQDALLNVISVYLALCILFFVSRKNNNLLSAKTLLLSGIPYFGYLLFVLYKVIW